MAPRLLNMSFTSVFRSPARNGSGEITSSNASAANQGSGDFDGVRAYRRGDPLKLVVWKKAAQAFARGSDNLVSRDAEHLQRSQLWLAPERTGLQEPEARLSRLTAWVLEAERLGLDYGLRLPGQEIAPDHGPAQRQRCLQALALA